MKYLLLLIVLIGNAYAIDKTSLEKEVESLNSARKDFSVKLSEVLSNFETYIERRQKECLGEFSSFVESNIQKKVVKKVKLTENEKKLCQLTLIEFQIKFLNKAFELREEYLVKRYDQESVILNKLRDKTVSELKKKARLLK